MRLKRGLALLLFAAALSGCGEDGDGEKPREPPLATFIPDPPPGYRYAPAPNAAGEAAFRAKITKDFAAEDVELRNVYRGAKFAAGVVVLRSARPHTIEAVASKVVPGPHGVDRVTIGGKGAHLVVATTRPGANVVDTFDRVVLVVTAEEYATARRIAGGLIR